MNTLFDYNDNTPNKLLNKTVLLFIVFYETIKIRIKMPTWKNDKHILYIKSLYFHILHIYTFFNIPFSQQYGKENPRRTSPHPFEIEKTEDRKKLRASKGFATRAIRILIYIERAQLVPLAGSWPDRRIALTRPRFSLMPRQPSLRLFLRGDRYPRRWNREAFFELYMLA